jgi:hypothetical protein
MRLTQIALQKIDVLETRLKLALIFKVTERRVSQMIDKNKNNGPLTTAAALQLLREDLKMDDSEILEEIGVSNEA